MLDQKVAEYLLQHGWVTATQIDEARRTQGFFGGHLESHLLKLGYVSEAVLGEALTEVAGVPFASWDHLRAVSQATLDSVPERLVSRFRVCPIRLEEGYLRIATLNPRDAVAVREIQAATGLVVEPWITIEPRLYQALERWYRLRFEGTKRIALATRPDGATSPRPGRETDATAEVARSEPEVGLDGRPLDAETNFEDYLARSNEPIGDADAPAARSQAAGHEPRGVRPHGDSDSSAAEAFDEALASSRDRNDIADALLGFCAGRASRTGLFVVGKDAVRGIAGHGRAFETERLTGFSVAIGSGTIFDTALQSRDFYFGVVPGLPANRDVYTALGGRLPAQVMLLPIVVKERTVALLYLDGDEGPLPRPDIPLMRRVAAKTSLSFEMLLLRNKLREI